MQSIFTRQNSWDVKDDKSGSELSIEIFKTKMKFLLSKTKVSTSNIKVVWDFKVDINKHAPCLFSAGGIIGSMYGWHKWHIILNMYLTCSP